MDEDTDLMFERISRLMSETALALPRIEKDTHLREWNLEVRLRLVPRSDAMLLQGTVDPNV